MIRRLRFVSLNLTGTCIDSGCHAPVALFQQAFAGAGVPVTVAEARRHMGLHKRDHVRELLASVKDRWHQKHGAFPAKQEEETIYASLAAIQTPLLRQHSVPITGVRETFNWCQSQRLFVTGTTGYTHSMVAAITPQLLSAGLSFDSLAVSDGVAKGRPSPLMIHSNMESLGLSDRDAGVKVGDTVNDIEEGRNAGLWTVGVIDTGNYVGYTEREFGMLDRTEQNRLRKSASSYLRNAHMLIPTIASLPAALLAIDGWIASGR